MKKIEIPGSKSISNRALVLGALGKKSVLVRGLLESDDTRYLQQALENLGVIFEWRKEGLNVSPPKNLEGDGSENFIGNGGTPARFLSAISLVTYGSFQLHGVDRMHERPFQDLFTALQSLDVTISSGKEGFLPAIFSSNPAGRTEQEIIEISGEVSSQFISGLMLAGTRMTRGLVIKLLGTIPSRPYVEMTQQVIQSFGGSVEIDTSFSTITIKKGLKSPETYKVPGDASSASYPLAYGLLTGQSVSIDNYGEKTLQGDESFLEILEKAGAKIERVGEACVLYPSEIGIRLLGIVDFSAMPDVSMTGMVLAALADGYSEFHGLESLRVKECDRIAAMQEGLLQLGVKVEVEGDVMKIWGNSGIKDELEKKSFENLKIDSRDDHRIAFCFAILLAATTKLNVREIHDCIIDAHSVTKSWPDFWADLAEWCEQLRPVSGVIVKKYAEKAPFSKGGFEGCQYLIVKKPRKNNAWQFPQGGVDAGESGWQAAKRELVEECGESLCVKFKGEQALGTYQYLFPADFKRHDPKIVGAKVSFFRAEYIDGEVEVDGKEIIDHKWVVESELKDYFDSEYLKKMKKML